MVRDRHGAGVDSNVCCCFYGSCVKKIALQALKTELGTCGCGILMFLISLSTGTFYMHCIYKLITTLQDVLMKSLFE